MASANFIGHQSEELEQKKNAFTVEALASVLKPEWIVEALRETQRESVRVRRLPAAMTLWLLVLMGLFRRVSYFYCNRFAPNLNRCARAGIDWRFSSTRKCAPLHCAARRWIFRAR